MSSIPLMPIEALNGWTPIYSFDGMGHTMINVRLTAQLDSASMKISLFDQIGATMAGTIYPCYLRNLSVYGDLDPTTYGMDNIGGIVNILNANSIIENVVSGMVLDIDERFYYLSIGGICAQINPGESSQEPS